MSQMLHKNNSSLWGVTLVATGTTKFVPYHHVMSLQFIWRLGACEFHLQEQNLQKSNPTIWYGTNLKVLIMATRQTNHMTLLQKETLLCIEIVFLPIQALFIICYQWFSPPSLPLFRQWRFQNRQSSQLLMVTIWWQRSWSILAQIMACCMTAPSYSLNYCWLIIGKALWHSSEGNFTRDTSAVNQ